MAEEIKGTGTDSAPVGPSTLPTTTEEISPLEKAKKEGQSGGKATGETITLPKETFDRIVQQLDMLEKVADVGRVAKWKAQHKGYENKRCKLSIWTVEKKIEKKVKDEETGEEKVTDETIHEDKVIVGWKMWEDLGAEPNARGVWVEKQVIQIALEDGSKETLDYIVFVRRGKKIGAEIIKESTETIGGQERVIFTLKAENGKEYEIDKTFVN